MKKQGTYKRASKTPVMQKQKGNMSMKALIKQAQRSVKRGKMCK
jgi:hypothetical protein